MRRFLWLALIVLWLTACTPTTETAVPPQSAPETAVLPTTTVPPPVITEEIPQVAEATDVPDPAQPPADPTATVTEIVVEPTATEAIVETGVMSGRTEEGAFFLGDPNAPITHIDYSDFL